MLDDIIMGDQNMLELSSILNPLVALNCGSVIVTALGGAASCNESSQPIMPLFFWPQC